MSETAQTYRRRRLTALAALIGVLLVVALGIRACTGEEVIPGVVAKDDAEPAAAKPATLPGGGRRIFPNFRVVGFYGAPQDKQLGALGIGTPDEAAARLRKVARGYERQSRPVLPAFELIATIAADAPGEDGMYRMHQPDEVIDRYLRAARRAKALLLLDIQPGRADFLTEARRLERWLREPDVGLALDPEWHVGAGEVPGQVLGSVTAEEVNEVSAYLSAFVSDHDLPDKLFVVHQFTSSMIENKDQVEQRLGLALTMNVDGFGDRPNKVSKYDLFTSELTRFHNGFKLFYEEDTNLMSPRQVLALRPPPDLVVYE